MINGVLFLLAVILVILFYISKSDEESRKNKIILSVIVVVIVIFAVIYENYKSSISKKERAVLSAFEKGKQIKCAGVVISKKDFIYVSGTNTLSAKHDSVEYTGMIYELKECQIQ